MYIRQNTSDDQSQSKLWWILSWLLLWVICTLWVYAFFNLNRWFPSNSSSYDTWSNSGSVPSVWDYLFGSGWTGGFLSWSEATWDIITWITLQYPTWYMEEYNKALIILQNDSLVNTFIDTESLISSGFDGIKINNPGDTSKPNFSLVWKVDPLVDKVYIIWVNKDWAYHFDTINKNNDNFSYEISANKANIKPWANTYYIVARTVESKYILWYIKVNTTEGMTFYESVDSICMLDLCSDPKLPKTFSTWSNSIIQQSLDWKTVIQITPDKSITIAYKENSMPQASLKRIKKVWDYYQKTSVSWWEPSISQKFVDKNNTMVSAIAVWLAIPNKLSFGNIAYISPKINFENSSLSFQKVEKIDASLIINATKASLKLEKEYGFALSDWTYVIYTLDTSSLKVMNPSNTDGTYKIIPKVVEWMKNRIVYTVPSTEIGLHDTISSYFKWLVIEKTATCANAKPNDDANAKFWLFPIDGQYDVVWFWNCYGVK